jgi:hypothetical protein
VILHSNFKVRKHSQDILKRIFKWDSSKLVICLCDCVFSTVNENSLECPSAKGLIEFVYTLANLRNLTTKELETILLKCLMLSNSKLAKKIDKNLFSKFIHKLIDNNKVNITMTAQELLSCQKNDIIQIVTNGQILSEVEVIFNVVLHFKIFI